MGIPLAVSPSALAPGLYLTVNLLASVASAGAQVLRGIIMAPKAAAGTLTPDTEIRNIFSTDDAKIAWGTKSPGYLAAFAFFEEYPSGTLVGIAPTASAGATATVSNTFASTPTASRTVRFIAAGVQVDVPWAASETADVLKARALTYLNGRDDYPATATSGGVGIVVQTFPVAGPWGNDVLYEIQLLTDGAGGTIDGAASVSGSFAGGTTEPDFTTALTTMSGARYDFILGCCSNADVQSNSATSNPGRIKTKIGTLNTGLNAKLQRAIFGVTGALATAKVGAIARNDAALQYVYCKNGRALPSEWGGCELGGRMRDVQLDPAANRIGTALKATVAGAKDLVADTPSQTEIEDALGNGLSIISYDAGGNPLLVRPVTTHSQDTLGNPDRRVLDTSGVDGVYAVANDVEIFLPQEFPQAKIAKDQVAGEEPLPKGVVEERDIKTAIITRLRFWQRRGVVRKDKLDDAITAGTLIVQVDPSDEGQVDIVIPLAIYKGLAKFGVVINKIA
jgi:phage tail sheath gpL-like